MAFGGAGSVPGMGGGGANTAFTILGFVGVDDRQALAALNNIMGAANLMATSANRMAEAAERSFQRYNRAGAETTRTTISLKSAFEALATASFVQTMESFSSSMFEATRKMQGFQRTLVGVTGSAIEARKVLRDVSNYADRTPVDTDQLKEAAVRFASLKQEIIPNLDLSAKLSYLFGVDLPRASQTVAEANGGVIDSLRRLKVEFAFTADQAQKYGAVVAKGHVAIGRPGSETNDRLMKALRAFVHDREKGLPGGDLFGGQLGIGGAFSNLRSGIFLTMAQLGKEVAPLVVTIAQGFRKLLDMFRELPSPILSLVAHFALFTGGLASLLAVLTPFFGFLKLISLVNGMATAMAGLAAGTEAAGTAAAGAAAGGVSMLSVGFGILAAAVIASQLAFTAYLSYLEKVDEKTVEATKNMADFHKSTQGRLEVGGKSLTDKNLTGKDLKDAGYSGEDAARIAQKFKSRAEVNTETGEYDDQRIQAAFKEYEKAKFAREKKEQAGVLSPNWAEDLAVARDGEKMAKERFDKSKEHWTKPAETLEKYAAAQFLPSLQKMFTNILAIANGQTKKDPREYHEVMAEADHDAQNRALNIPGSDRKFQAKRLQSQVTESEESIKTEREAQIQRTIRENGKITEAERTRINSGERDDPEQWKAYIELRKRLNEVKKEGLEIGQKERDQADKMAEVTRADTYESRIQSIEAERVAFAQAYADKVISEEQYDEKVQELSLRRAEEDQKKVDAQTDMNAELAKLYGEDYRASEIELHKKVLAWRRAGVDEVDIEKSKHAERLKVQSEAAVKELQIAQKIADDKAAVRAKKAGNREAVLQERQSQGEAVGGELRSARTEEAEAQKKDIDSKKNRQRQILKSQLKAATDPRDKKRIEAELGNLDAAANAEKEGIDQTTGARNRSDEKAEAARTGQANVGAEEISSARLGVKNQVLQERLEAGGDPAKIGKEMLDNVRKQYELNRQILEDKEKLAEAGKTEAEKQNLRNQLELDKLKLQEDSLKAAQAVTAEIEKQNELQGKGKSGFSMGTYSSYEDAMKAEQADSDAMRAKHLSSGKKKDLAKRLGIDPSARSRILIDPAAARASGGDVAMPGKTGLEKTHQRWNQINEAGKKGDLKGRAHLQVTIQAKDANGKPFAQSVHEAIIPMDKSVAQDLRNPLGGSGGMN